MFVYKLFIPCLNVKISQDEVLKCFENTGNEQHPLHCAQAQSYSYELFLSYDVMMIALFVYVSFSRDVMHGFQYGGRQILE